MPRVKPGDVGHPVMICGGGPSLDAQLDKVRAHPGDIWAVNHTADWLLDRGVDAVFCTVDPLLKSTTAARRIVATCANPSLHNDLTQVFAAIEHEKDGVPGGTTTATRLCALAVRLGYPGVIFVGTDSCFTGADHVDRDERLPEQLIVRAGGRDYLTYPELYMQAQCIADIVKVCPEYFQNWSGGLVDAMLSDPDWEVVAVSTKLRDSLVSYSGCEELYAGTYVAAGRSGAGD